MSVRRLYLMRTALCGVLFSISAGTAFAAEPENEDEARSDIVVTGLREQAGLNAAVQGGALGNKTLLDTPFSITVVDREDIDKRQATSIGQIFINDPSVVSSASPGTTNWWGTQIRGLGVRNYYVDDVPLLLYWGGDFPLESVESVEALKGLSGFMYGFGAPGGVISYRTKRPTDQPLLATELGWRSSSDFFARIDAGGPLWGDGKLGYRVNLAGEKGTAYNKAGVNRLVASLALEYEITPDVKWYATATYEDSKLRHEPFQIYWSAYEDDDLPKPTYDYGNVNIDNSYYQARTLAAATGLDWQFAQEWSARLTYGYTSKLHHSNKMFVYLLNQAGDYEGNAYNFAELDRNHFAQAMLQGEVTTGPIRHEIVAGVSFMANNADFGLNDYYWGNDFNGNIYQKQTFLVTRDISYGTDGSPTRERQYAAFLSDTLHLGEHVQVILGARYNRYRLLDSDGDASTDSSYRTSALTPTAAVIYKPASYLTLYGSYVEALEAGSRVSAQYANFNEVLKPTISKQYELGVKYEYEGLSLSSAAFRIERANTMEKTRDDGLYLTQDGLSVYKGVEASASYRVSRDLRLGLGAIYLDAAIADVEDADIIGNVPSEAAKWQLVANGEYSVAAVPGLSVHGNVRYSGKSPTTDYDTLYIPSRTIANIGAQYETVIADRKVLFTANLNNIFNKKYWTQSGLGEAINGSISAKVFW